jgi:membrane protein
VAVNDAVERILTNGTAGLIAFASVLAIWQVSSAVRITMSGMNRLYETDETRPLWLRSAISIGLALAFMVAVFASFALAVIVRHLGHGAVDWLLSGVRWLAVVILLWVAVTLLVRFAPAERRAKKWVSAGGALVVVAWIATSLAFGLFVSRIANFRTAEGNLAVFFVLTTYIYVGAIVFLVGEQLDELARSKTAKR